MKSLGTINNPKELFSLINAAGKDETRVHLSNVWLSKNGFAYGCDGHILAARHHDLTLDCDIPVNAQISKQLCKITDPIEVFDNDDPNEPTAYTFKSFHSSWGITQQSLSHAKMPNMEALTPQKTAPTEEIGLNLYLVERLRKALGLTVRNASTKLVFQSKLGPIKVTVRDNDNAYGLIMPMRIN